MKTRSLKCKFKNEGFNEFLDLLEDISKIDDVVKLKISSDKIFMYSMKGKDNIILAFKNYRIDTEDFIEKLDLSDDIDIIIPNAKKFVKNLKFIDIKENIDFTLKVRELSDGGLETRGFEVKNKKLKIKWLTAEQYEIKDIQYESLMGLLDIKKENLNFDVDRNDFEDIKKLANINGSELIEILSNKGTVTMSEHSSWEIEVDKIENELNINYNVNKNLLKFINDGSEPVRFHVFPNFLLVRDAVSNVMVSFEQSY